MRATQILAYAVNLAREIILAANDAQFLLLQKHETHRPTFLVQEIMLPQPSWLLLEFRSLVFWNAESVGSCVVDLWKSLSLTRKNILGAHPLAARRAINENGTIAGSGTYKSL